MTQLLARERVDKASLAPKNGLVSPPQESANLTSQVQREALGRLIAENGENYKSLSLLLKRNPAYIQQFIKRGIPRQLSEEDRIVLARHFGVDETVLGSPRRSMLPDTQLVRVPLLDRHIFPVPQSEKPQESDISGFAVIPIRDDAMAPEIVAGDYVVIDPHDNKKSLRDGLYAVQRDSIVSIRRVSVSLHGRTIILSGKDWSLACSLWQLPSTLTVVGRVVWIVRRPSTV